MAKRPGDVTPAETSVNRSLERTGDLDTARENLMLEPANEDKDLTAAADTDASDETEQLRSRIEETRSELGETIDAIQEKLSFSNISDQVSEQVTNAIETAKDSAYDATIGKVTHFMKNTGKEISRSSLVKTAKENPLPFILIAAGAGLLAYQGFSRSGPSRRKVRYGSEPRRMGQESHGEMASAIDRAQSGLNTVSETVTGTAGTVKDSVSHAAKSAFDGVSNIANRASESASNLGTKAAETYEHYMDERPWAIGVVALAAGAAIGMAIPSTKYEGRLMGEARVNLLDKVSHTAADFVEKAKQAAADAGKAVSETVSDEAKTLVNDSLGK